MIRITRVPHSTEPDKSGFEVEIDLTQLAIALGCIGALLALTACATAHAVPTAQLFDMRQCVAACEDDGKTVIVCDNAKPNVMIVPACAAPDKGVQARLETAK